MTDYETVYICYFSLLWHDLDFSFERNCYQILLFLTLYNSISILPMYSSCQNGRINIYKVLNSSLHNEFTFYSNSVQWTIIDTKLSPDSRFVAYSSWSGSVHLIPFREDQTEIQLVLSESSSMAYYDFYRCAFSLSFSEDSKEV